MSTAQKLQSILGGYAVSVRGQLFFTIIPAKGHVDNVLKMLTAAGFNAFYDEEEGEINAD